MYDAKRWNIYVNSDQILFQYTYIYDCVFNFWIMGNS